MAKSATIAAPRLKALYNETFAKELQAELGLSNINEVPKLEKIIVSGIRTEQCCETTTRVASDLGYQVDFVSEATMTFPMTHSNGSVYSADEIKARTELVLAGRFARIVTVAQLVEAAFV